MAIHLQELIHPFSHRDHPRRVIHWWLALAALIALLLVAVSAAGN